jgi:hypothetical protein
MCADEVGRSDVILVENFDPNYLVFERAAALEDAGLSTRVVVPTAASGNEPDSIDSVSRGIAELMTRLARVRNATIIPVHDKEPITLNAAYQIRDVLTRERLTSVIVVAPALRSRRSSLVYRAVLAPAGIQVHCVPVMGEHTPETWTATWHGIQDVIEQFIKLQYYRFYVLPLSRARSRAAAADSPAAVPHAQIVRDRIPSSSPMSGYVPSSFLSLVVSALV